MLFDEDDISNRTSPKMRAISTSHYNVAVPTKTSVKLKSSQPSRGETKSIDDAAERETYNETQQIISSEMKQVKQFARAKSM